MERQLVWDTPKRLANLYKHRLDSADVTVEFFDSAVVESAKRGRFKALGYLQGRAVALIFAPLGNEGLAIVSLRPAKPAERGKIDGIS